MKRRVFIWVVGLALLLPCQVGRAEIIKIGYFTNKPFMYLNDKSGKPQGATITYVETMAANMGYAVEWIGPLPLIRYATYLQEGSLDAGASLVLIPETEGLVYPGAKPYDFAQSVFVIRKANPLTEITSIQDVERYRVGWLANISPSPFVQEHLARLQMDYLTPGDNMDAQGLTKLLLGRIDAIHQLNAYSLLFVAQQMHVADQIKVLPLPEPPTPIFVGFSKNSPRSKLLLSQYNTVQAVMRFEHADYVKLIQQEFDHLAHP